MPAARLTAVKFFLEGPVGRLEAEFERPEGTVLGASVVGHPHPQHGGTMRNTVVFRTARALRSAGLATLRFNFRGVEESEGEHDGAGAEVEDMRACQDWLAGELPGLPLWAAGFSFGARTALGLAVSDARVRRVVCVAPPVLVYDLPELDRVEVPVLCVFGSRDEFGTLADFRERHPRPGELVVAREIEGADHLFRGRTPLVEACVADYAAEWTRRR